MISFSSFSTSKLQLPKKLPKKTWLLVPVILISGWLLWSHFKNTTATPPTYQTAQVERGTIVVSVSSAGQISTANSLPVTTNVSGVVKKITAKNDQVVKSGEALLEIELDPESQQAYTQASATYQAAKNNLVTAQTNFYTLQAAMLGKWDTYKELAESDTYSDVNAASRALPEFVIPQNEWLAAEAQYKNQQAVVSQAQTALSSASQSLKMASPVIYAPISGTLSGLSLQVGSVLSTQSDASDSSNSLTLARITTEALPTVTLNLTEIDVTKVKLDHKATITLDALGDKTYTGKVISIDTAGSVSSGVTSYPTVIAFDTAADDIFANMSAQANIITETKNNVLLVSSSAIQTQNGQSIVRVLKDNQPQSVVVETGLSSSTQTEITSGLTEGETIITSSTQPTTGVGNSSQTTSPFSTFGGAGSFGVTSGSRANVVRVAQ